jgi:tetratricopeptide (TPR) repeat protein
MVAGMIAQAQAKVTSAYNANKEGKYEAAKGFIDEALTDPKATEKEKFWRYRGDIYMNIALDSTLSTKYPESLIESLKSYKSAIEKKTDYSDEISNMLLKGFDLSQRKYIKLYDNKRFCDALSQIEICKRIVDLNSNLNSKSEGAFILNEAKKSISENLQSISNLCISEQISELVKINRHQDALDLIKKEKQLNPSNIDLLTFESDIYLSLGKYEDATKPLEELIKSAPNNIVYHNILGNLYQKIDEFSNDAVIVSRILKKGDSKSYVDSMLTKYNVELTKSNNDYYYKNSNKILNITFVNDKINIMKSENLSDQIFSERAAEQYSISINIDSTNYDAHYNLGAQLYNQAQEKFVKCNSIPSTDKAGYDACNVEKKLLYLKSAEHFKVCFEQDNKNSSLKQILKETYLKGGEREKSNLYK